MDSGSRLKISGEGEPGHYSGPPGDLYVILEVEEHPFFKRDGAELFCDFPVSFTNAALGAEVEVPTLDGSAKLRIPAGTPSGKVFTLKGKGGIMTADVSTNSTSPTKKDMTLTVVATAARGTATTVLIGFYGATPIDQGTMTATALTALTTNPTFSASNTGAGVFGFASSTEATAYVTRVQQMQADLDTLMARFNSTGLVNITGL